MVNNKMNSKEIDSEDECPGEFTKTEGKNVVKGLRKTEQKELLNNKTQKKQKFAKKNVDKEKVS